MTQQHTPEPWEQFESIVYMGMHGGFDLAGCPLPEANARRIVACVNACAGLDTEYLETVGLPEFVGKQLCADMVQQELDAVTAQRDQLREALEFYADKQRYMGSNQRIDSQDKYGESPSNTVYLWDVMKDNGDIARAALAATEDKQ